MDSLRFFKYIALIFLSIYFIITPINTYCQQLPISYYYLDPLYFTTYGYINSITDPFYYLGYGYKPPIAGNDLLGAYSYNPFLDPYAVYLYNYFDSATYPYLSYIEAIPFPYQALPGTFQPYGPPNYPTYSFGLVDYYLSWINLQ
ncbi:MAG: hypothetical protein ACMUJM_09955 [bacterium]